jgi:hypothetical protein
MRPQLGEHDSERGPSKVTRSLIFFQTNKFKNTVVERSKSGKKMCKCFWRTTQA